MDASDAVLTGVPPRQGQRLVLKIRLGDVGPQALRHQTRQADTSTQFQDAPAGHERRVGASQHFGQVLQQARAIGQGRRAKPKTAESPQFIRR